MKPYRKLALVSAAHLGVMFAATYALVAETSHIYLNLNRLYMAILMVSPMVALMVTTMGDMYASRKLNRTILVVAVVAFLGSLTLLRTQASIGDTQFLRSMIPHHSSAILMCREGHFTDPEIRTLCDQIVRSQTDEIRQMKTILSRR
jgi:uncharacterized protein (DUF305 family)